MKKASDPFPLACLGVILGALAVSGVHPYERFTWWLEIVPILIVVPILIATYRRFPLTHFLYALITVHAVILAVGGHYTYARVPLFNLVKNYFHEVRNSYDGVGHLAQGLVPAIAARELLIRTSPLKPGKWLFALIILSCLGISAIYEILEWLASYAEGGKAEDFLGTQGDPWDTQKDMALAGVGAAIGLLFLSRWHDKSLQKLTASIRTSR